MKNKKPGPGRPRLTNKKVSITIRIKPELLSRITGNRSAFIEEAIKFKLLELHNKS
jgi:hypothetical protein